MKKMTHHLTLVSLGLALCFGSANLWAQSAANYPDKPVKVIIPFPPGGTLDKIGRMLALKMGEQLGQNFVVENRPGGNGIIGADVVAKANADGYTLLFNASTFVTAPMTMKSVPYKGTGPAMTDLVGGQIEGFIDPVLGSVQFHRSGQLKVVGVTSSKRLPNLPDVATVSETIPDFQCSSWYGLWGPSKLPADMVQKLNAAVNKALSGEMRDRLIADGIVPAGGSAAEFAKFQADDIAISGKIIADKKIALD